jgi:hypothetical protein
MFNLTLVPHPQPPTPEPGGSLCLGVQSSGNTFLTFMCPVIIIMDPLLRAGFDNYRPNRTHKFCILLALLGLFVCLLLSM